MRMGILTSGGDFLGLNAVIRGAALKSSLVPGNEFVGFKYGWQGDVIPEEPLDRSDMRVGQFRPAPGESSRYRCRGRICARRHNRNPTPTRDSMHLCAPDLAE